MDKITHSFIVENECAGWRLDHFLRKKIPRLSRNRLQRVIKGECWVDGRECKPATILVAGQTVMFRRPAPKEPDAPRELPVLVADEWFYAVDKPAGIAMHPSAKYHHSTITSVLREKFPDEKLQITHRLDLETSGVLLIARSVQSAIALKRAFAKRWVKKTYLAVVRGRLDGEISVDAPLGLAGGLVRVKMAVLDGGLPSRTRFVARESWGDRTLVECFPETGRQHQIRAHLAHIGYPIVGDKLYPDEHIFADYQDHGWEAIAGRVEHARQALHAFRYTFPHPVSGAEITVESPLAADLAALRTSEPAE
jgi:23S rRNA pseudouridine1911/1915/1917 synthase